MESRRQEECFLSSFRNVHEMSDGADHFVKKMWKLIIEIAGKSQRNQVYLPIISIITSKRQNSFWASMTTAHPYHLFIGMILRRMIL